MEQLDGEGIIGKMKVSKPVLIVKLLEGIHIRSHESVVFPISITNIIQRISISQLAVPGQSISKPPRVLCKIYGLRCHPKMLYFRRSKIPSESIYFSSSQDDY